MKKLFTARLAICLALAAAMILPSCKRAVDPNEALDGLASELFRQTAESDTLTANFLVADRAKYGLKDYPEAPATFGEFGYDAIKNEMEHMQGEYDKLKAIDRDKLTEDRKLTYDVLEASFLLDLADGKAADFVYYFEVLSPTVGIQAQLPVVLAEYNFDGTKNLDEYLALLADAPNYFSQLEAFEREKSEHGLFMSRETCDDVVEQCEKFIASPESNLLITHFESFIDGLDDLTDEEKTSYKEKNRDAVLGSVIPAYEALIETLRGLRATGEESGGLGNYPLGREYYEYLVRTTVGTPKSIEEIEAEIDDAMDEAISDMYAAMFSGGDDLFAEMENDIFDGDDPREILLHLKEAMERDYPALARDVEFSINYVDESLSEHLSPAFYLLPRIDDDKENKIYINPGADTATPLFTVLAHEGFPGHMYQRNYYKQLSPAPVRSALSFTGYAEGWAVDVEKRSFYYADISEAAAGALSANQAINYLLMAKADIGVNYHGWDKSELASYLTPYGVAGEDVVDRLYKSCAAEPGNVMTYAFGSAEIERLRDKAETELGDDFDLKAFHEFILKTGPASFDVIEKYMESWLAEQPLTGGAESAETDAAA
jgi:uncharacterized protein (DUF885 family)